MTQHKTLLLIVGPGRSGTSTLAGTLHKLGAHVAGPYLDANDSNPMGFFESAWSVKYHNAILRRASVRLADARPEAVQLVEGAVASSDRSALTEYLTEQAQATDLVVLKDPRIVWSLSTFRAVADELGMQLAAAVMLRHPAEVIASRLHYYRKPGAELEEAGYRARDLAGWINTLVTCERQTRDVPRAFIGYGDLLKDWRSALARALADLPASIALPPADQHHAVDDFIDPGLNRHRGEWPDDGSVLEELRRMAERAFDACTAQGRSGVSDSSTAELDRVHDDYGRAYSIVRAIAHDDVVAARAAARAKATRRARAEAAKAQQVVVAPSPAPATPSPLQRVRNGVARSARLAQQKLRDHQR